MKKIFTLFIVIFLSVGSVAFAQSVQQNTPLTISTVERQPFIFYQENGEVVGFSADLWAEIAQRNGWDYVWQKNDSFPAMIEGITSGNADVAIANISITSDRERMLDLSHSIYDSGLQIIVPNNEKGLSIFKVIWQSGAIQLIGFALVILLIIAHILWFFERNTPNSRHDYFRDDYLGGVWDAFWWAFIIMTMGGFENEVPASKFSRLLAMFWIVASLFFVSTLTAKITTSLTIDQLTSDINSVSDLSGKKIGVGENSAMSKFLDNKNISYIKYKDFLAALAAVENGELDATIGDAPIVKYYVAHEGRGKVQLAGATFQPDKFGIALPTGSSLKEKINTTILAIREDGTYEQLQTKWFGNE